MTREEAKHIVDVAFDIPLAVRRVGEDRTYQADEIRKAKGMAIEALEQEPKTGHWIYIRNSEVNGLKICKCSNCEKKTYGSHNYCPNCGAKMIDS